MTGKKNIRISFEQFMAEAEHFKKQNVFLVYGPEPFQRNESVQTILKMHKITEFDGFDTFIYYGDDFSSKSTSIQSVIEQLQMYPFVQPLKTVVIRNYDEMSSDAQEQLIKYCAKAHDQNLIILAGEKADTRTNRVKKLMECSTAIECKELRYPLVLAKWVNDELRRRQLIMDERAKQKFLNSVDLDFYTAFNELNKLEIYIGNSKTIRENDVKECTVLSKNYTVFDLVDEVGYRRKEKALTILENLIQNEESAIMVMVLFTNFFMTLWKLNVLKAKNISENEIKSRYMSEINLYYRDKYFAFIKNYNIIKIEKILDLILQSDRKAKLSMCSDHVLLTMLIYEICTMK